MLSNSRINLIISWKLSKKLAVLAVFSTVIGITIIYYSLFQSQVRQDIAVSAKLLRDTGDFESAGMNGESISLSSEYDDINVDGYLLSNLAERYDDMRLGVLISLYLLWLEKSQPMLEDICSFADESCYVDPQMLSGARCYQAVLFDEGWCFFSKEPELVPPESLVECELWRIIEQEPLLCLPISCQPDVGTHLIRRTNKDAFAIYVPTDELNGGDDK